MYYWVLGFFLSKFRWFLKEICDFKNSCSFNGNFSGYQEPEAHNIYVQNQARPIIYTLQIIIYELHTTTPCEYPVMPNSQKVANWQLFLVNMVFRSYAIIKHMYTYSDSTRVLRAWLLDTISQNCDDIPLFGFPRNHIHIHGAGN